MDQPFDTTGASWLVKLGRRLFPYRGFVGLPFLILCLLLARPVPPNAALLGLGWGLMLAGLATRIWGVAGWYAPGATQQTQGLITNRGPYIYSRNPRYVGNLAMGLGLCAIAHLPYLWLPFFCLWGSIHIPVIHAEEAVLLRRYGNDFQDYLNSVARFWGPASRSAQGTISGRQWLAAIGAERQTWAGWIMLASCLSWWRFH